MSTPLPVDQFRSEADPLGETFNLVKSAVGRPFSVRTGVIRTTDLQRFAVASDDYNPIYFDHELAATSGHDGLAAPPLYLSSVLGWEAGPPECDLRQDGIGNELALLPIDGVGLMGVGQDIEFLGAVRAGMQFSVVSTLDDVEIKSGRSGMFLLLVIAREFKNEEGDVVLRCRESYVGRAYG
jgi:acyl dehydratase